MRAEDRRVAHDEEFVPRSVEEDACDHFAMNFVESGEFELASEKRLQAGDAFVCQPGIRGQAFGSWFFLHSVARLRST
jgi:hypothetical protein